MKRKLEIGTLFLCFSLGVSLLFSNRALANNKDSSSEKKLADFISQNLRIKKIEVKGNTIFQTEINSLVSEYENRSLSGEELEEIANKITQIYLNEGYITTRAVLEEIRGDVAIIQVYEGEIEAIEIEGGGVWKIT